MATKKPAATPTKSASKVKSNASAAVSAGDSKGKKAAAARRKAKIA